MTIEGKRGNGERRQDVVAENLLLTDTAHNRSYEYKHEYGYTYARECEKHRIIRSGDAILRCEPLPVRLQQSSPWRQKVRQVAAHRRDRGEPGVTG